MSTLEVSGLRAGYGGVEVLRGTDLRVPAGRLVALLGPSGCGKTTLLRTIAGFHRADAGRVLLGGRVLEDGDAHVPAHRRRITVVPQEGALFPHLDVETNIAFGLKGGPRHEIRARVDHMLGLVGLADERRRQPHQLSGGQQQRVALARALAPQPDLVLLDEPFSSLDASRRESLRDEVRDLLAAEHATALLVTHDQTEALSLATEVAVMRDGTVHQQGSPADVYARPTDAWTARFVGDAVLLNVSADQGVAPAPFGPIDVEGHGPTLLLRPEQIRLGGGEARGVVVSTRFHGPDSRVVVDLTDGTRITVRTPGAGPAAGTTVRLGVAGPGWLLPG